MATKYIVDNVSGQTITGDLTINGSLSATTISGTTFYGDGSNLTGVSGGGETFTGGTVTGVTTFTNTVSANTISATTLYVNGNSISQPYKVYSALLTQTGTSDPTAIVLENPSALVITFTRLSAGVYTVDSISFVRGKVIINNMNPYIESSWPIGNTSVDFPKIAVSGGPPSATCEIKIPNSMSTTGTLISFSTSENGVNKDDVLSKYLGFIEIRVYN